MYSTSVIVSLAILSAAAPSFAAPLATRFSLPVSTIAKELGGGLLTGGAFAGLEALLDKETSPAARELAARDLEARLKLPIGTIIKSLGGGLLTGGAFAGLESLLEGNTKRELSLEARAGFAGLLDSLIGVGEKELPAVIKNAIIGGAASGATNGIASSIFGSRAVGGKVVGEVIEDTLGTTIAKGALSGLGSAIGGTAIGAIFDKLFNKRSFEDLTEDEINTLATFLESSDVSKRALSDLTDDEIDTLTTFLQSVDVTKRAVGGKVVGEVIEDTLGTTVAKGVLSGLGSAIGGTAVGAAFDKLFNKRALENLTEDELTALATFLQSADVSKREPEPLGSIGKGAIGLVASLGASELAGGLVDKIESLFKREMSLDELD